MRGKKKGNKKVGGKKATSKLTSTIGSAKSTKSAKTATPRPRPSTAVLLKIFRETFQSLDSGKRGEIPVELIGKALRMNSQCPSEEELQRIIDDYTEEPNEDDIEPKPPVINFEDFCAIMKENWKSHDQLKEDIDSAFATLDRSASNGEETGMISADNLRQWMLTLGESLEENEVNEMIKEAAGMDGKIPYDQFSNILLDGFCRPASKKKKGSAKSGGKKKGAKKK